MKRVSVIVLFMVSFFSSVPGFAQATKEFEHAYFINKKDTLPYRILFPVNFNPDEKYPLVLFLHGAGERGVDNELQLFHGSDLFLKDANRHDYPAVVVFPQCPTNDFWSNVERRFQDGKNVFNFQIGGKPTPAMKLLTGLVKDLESRDYLDKERFYVGGLSMGGMGTLEILRRQPKTFVAAFSICGGDDPLNTPEYADRVAIWLFHGAEDDVVELKYSEVVAESLERLGPDVQFTVYPGVKHDSWENALAEPGLLPWLFSKKLE